MIMIDWNNMKCPVCGDGNMKEVKNTTYVILDDNVSKGNNIKVVAYMCSRCGNMLFRRR